MKKGDKVHFYGEDYQIAGNWNGDIVIIPLDPEDNNCLIYTKKEMKDFLESGELKRL